MKMKVMIQDKTDEANKEIVFITEKQKELNLKLGEVAESLENAEKDLAEAKDKLTKDIKNHVAEVKTYKKGSSADFAAVVTTFSTMLFKQTYKSDDEAKTAFVKNSMSLVTYLDKFTDDSEDPIPQDFVNKEKDKFTKKYVDSFAKRSKAIHAMAEWSMCALNMTWSRNSVMPLRKKNQKLVSELESKKKSLRKNQESLDELKRQKEKCDEDIKKSNSEIEYYQNEIKKSSDKVEKCKNI